MSEQQWDCNPDGSVAVLPGTGWSAISLIDGTLGGVRLEFAIDRTMKTLAANQLVFTAPQLRAFIQDMTALAEALEKPEPSGHYQARAPEPRS